MTLSDLGFGKRTPIQEFPLQKRYGGGVQAAKVSPKSGLLAVAVVADEQEEIVLTTARGRVTKLAVTAFHSTGRSVIGYRYPPGSKEPYVEPDKDGGPTRLIVLAGTKPVAGITTAGSTQSVGDAEPAKTTARRSKRAGQAPASPGSGSRKRSASKTEQDETVSPQPRPKPSRTRTKSQP